MSRKAILITVLSLTLVVAGSGLVHARGGWNGNCGNNQGQGMMGYGFGGAVDCGGPQSGDCYNRGGRSWRGGDCGNQAGDCNNRGGRNWRGGNRAQISADITMDEARGLVENRVSRNPYLKVGNVTENENGFEVQVVTKDGEKLVNRLQVDKEAGRIYRIFE